MKIKNVVTSAGLTGFYFDDLEAIRRGAKLDGMMYVGEKPVTPGFTTVRQKGESISVMLILEDGQIAHGDCAAVQYSGIGGKDPVFLAKDFIPIIRREIAPKLIGRELGSFRELAEEIDRSEIRERRVHTAIRYGVTQAILDAVAKAEKKTMAEVIAEEYGTTISNKRIPLVAQTGDERYTNVDKMIIKKAELLPHGLINSFELVGKNGEKLLEYVEWVRNRILKLGESNYRPTITIDTYGMIGRAFKNDMNMIVEYIGKLVEAAKPFDFSLEMPIDAGSTEGQLITFKNLKKMIRDEGINVELVVDEWCSTLDDIKRFCDEDAVDRVKAKTPGLGGINNVIEAALYVKKSGHRVHIAESSNATDRCAQVGCHIALAVQADTKGSTPGMGVDEALMINYNEMNRTLALLRAIGVIT
jgi:methylaspartate ammonia-lyase